MKERARTALSAAIRAQLSPGPIARWLLLASLGSGCLAASDDAELRANAAAVIYGADDRSEPFAEPDARLRAASSATAAIVLRAAVHGDASGAVSLDAPSAQEAFDLCPDERFAQQPSAALCTAVLVAPDVALTAGHCLTWMSCERLALVFGFEQAAPDRLRPLRASDVYACEEVLAIEVDPPTAVLARDFAFVRLDRPAEPPLAPVALGEAAPHAGDRLIAIGHGAGLPTKIARNGAVLDPRAASGDYFVADVDNFGGGSGAGVFDQDARLLGIATSGEPDFEETGAGCMQVRRAAEGLEGEKIGYAEIAVDGLCDSDAGSALCAARAADSAKCSVSMMPPRSAGDSLALWPVGAIVALCGWRLRTRRSRAGPSPAA